MANVTSNTSWEVRSTGITTGGAAFDPFYGGTDYSQQDAPQLTHADGVISGTNLQSTLGGFTSQMVGNGVYLSNSQTWRQITAFVDSHNVTLLDAPAATSGNTFNVGGAYLVSQNGFGFPYQPGNVIWWRGSINPTVNQPGISSTDGTKYIRLRGYGTVRGDNGFGTIIGGSIAADTFGIGSNAIAENMVFDGNGSQARNGVTMSGSYSRLENCIIKGNVSAGGGVTILANYNEIKNCYIDCHNSTGTPVNVGTVLNPASGCVIEHNVIRGGGAQNGVTLNAGSFCVVQHNVIFGYSGGSGIIFFNGGSNWLQGASIKFNTIANSLKGINILNISTGMEHIDIQGNIFSNLTSTAIWWDGTDLTTIAPGTLAYLKCDIDTNAFWNCVAKYRNLPAGTNDITLTVDPFLDDVTTFDFHLNNTAGGGAACKSAWLIANPDAVTTSTFTLGALGQAAATTPAAPTSLTAVVTSSSTVSLAWVNNANNVDNFQVERSLIGGLFSVIATVGATTTTYIDSTVSANQGYVYKVNAVNSAGSSTFSNSVTVVIPGSIPTPAPPVIDEVQFPIDNSEGTSGGPSFSTIVTTSSTGFETRVPMWRVGKYKFTLIYSLKSPAKMIPVIAFFVARAGKGRGFRFKDWADFQATNEPLTVTGSKVIQLIKTYTSSSISYVRNIYKPQQNQVNVTLKRNGGGYSTFTLDTTTGVVTLTADVTKTITGITQAAQAVVTATAHGFSNGDYVYFENVQGMTQINGLVGVIQSNTTNSFTVNISSVAFSAYSAGGSAEKYVQPTETLTWSGEFDVPVRFDIDEMDVVQTASEIRDWTSVPVVEVLN